ncbi:PREDICTED: uncharacterized protein LOC109584823 isoform X2 [Amphimedon queenslandica]|uniref:Dynamin N-terminal domain-containing protein n=1 Tax=Amphimedon queenslandica TaxID=400682 RepID=A0AAN0JGU8_AMPQE|nr:PREDICTED: uncharacterized protein LOC109584823 isoform X2 [Amphimedon queenslandica]|eukprot:XP_019856260.1 PREDICTED: uncharacterized protein LOC109584823 isoform X2 [Amphimedon queenslandica]
MKQEKKVKELRDGALKKIDDSCKEYKEGGPCINEKELELFLHQIENKMLLVAVVGEGSCGKSTLINAFLRDKILPAGIGRVTGFRIFIGHDPNVHETPCESSTGYCDKCPYLVSGIGKEILCHGVAEIKLKITRRNQLNDAHQIDPLVLYTYIPVFDSLSSSTHCTPYFVDSPGVEVINNDVKSYYSILSAMIYVENYLRLMQNEANIITELGCKPEDASLLFAVSHFDKYYTSRADEQNPDKRKTKTEVECNMELVKRGEVFPVCGDWALHAHLALKYKERDEISCDVVEEAYRCKRVPKRKNFDEIVDKATCILEVSAFEELEKKLKISIDQTNFQQWIIMMYKQCIKLLKRPIQAADTILPIIESEIANKSKNIETINEKIGNLRTMEGEVQEYVLEQLEKIQQLASSFFMRRVSPKIEEELQILRRNGIESVNRNYTFGQYLEDLNTLINNLSGLITQELNDETKRCSKDLGSELHNRYTKLIRHIQWAQDDSRNVTLAAEVQTQNIADSCFISEPSNTIRGFVRNRTRNWRLLNSALAAASAGASVLATGAGFMTAIALNVLAIPAIVSSGAVITGLGGTAYFIRQFINTTDQSMELSEEDVKTLCDKMKSEITINSAGRIKQKFEQVVADALRDYNILLKAEYDQEWGQRLNQCLEEAQVSLRLICEKKTELTQARDELKKYSDSLKALVQETE